MKIRISSRVVFLLAICAAMRLSAEPLVNGGDGGTFRASLHAGDLVSLQKNTLHQFDPNQAAHARFFAIYYSASWCPPCRAFTPELVKFYDEVKAANPQFELILVCRDRSATDMEAYMKKDEMKWPALTFAKGRSHKTLNQYAGDGIPDLVLVDAQGKVLSDSYQGGKYVGPQKVLRDIQQILKQNPPTSEEIAQAKTASTSPASGSNTGASDFDTFFKKPAQSPKP